jgi:hypothetical protein
MAKLRPDIEWEPYSPRQWKRYGVLERVDGRWEVVQRASWWKEDERGLLAVVDTRAEAIGFVKLLKE